MVTSNAAFVGSQVRFPADEWCLQSRVRFPATQRWRELKSMPGVGRYLHGCCEIDEHCVVILGGRSVWNVLSSGFIYNTRTEQSSPLPNERPAARWLFSAVANKRYMYVIGGCDAYNRPVNTVYRLLLETYQRTSLAPMGTEQYFFAGVLLGDYI